MFQKSFSKVEAKKVISDFLKYKIKKTFYQ